MIRNKKRQIVIISAAVLLLFVLYLFGLDAKNFSEPKENEIVIYFLDTEQSDAILIEGPDGAVLIDSGDIDKGDDVVSFIRSKNIDKLNAFIVTHPHIDHIGGAKEVLGNFKVDTFYMPDIPDELYLDTVYYNETLELLKANDISFKSAKNGISFSVGEMNFDILSPMGEYSAVNDYSAVVKLKFKTSSFLFCGDIEEGAEKLLLESTTDLSADLIKNPHHGAASDLNESFLLRVKPRYAVITVGDNNYGHPSYKTLEELNSLGTEVYRTDICGTIAVFCDGTNFKIETEN